MSIAMLLQVGLNLIFGLVLFAVIKRLNRPAKDDPRLSRGLQLLQSKIAILEDLSDRTEVQVSQLVALMEHKSKDVQSKIQSAERQIHLINTSMEKSIEVAKIFQDKIPHQEIIERQNTIKYVQAARLANQGASVEEICEKVDLPLGEIEFIAKVNRSHLMFSEKDLPEWAVEPAPEASMPAEAQPAVSDTMTVGTEENEYSQNILYQAELEQEQEQEQASPQRDMSAAFDTHRPELGPLERLGQQFRQAVEEHNMAPPPVPAAPVPAQPTPVTIANRSAVGHSSVNPVIRKVQFPRINVSDNLK